MSLYTKYRPKNFAEVVGQDEAIKYFRNIIKGSENIVNIPHAFLLAGGHGIGKTTIARIFARELGTAEADIYELDAASSSKKIDDMREIIESVFTMPVASKYKVYIFDEAHMLTKDSSNAFLKVLEEPPHHVIFILCTTDPNKLISTIRSRCNVVNLVKPNIDILAKNLNHIIESEKITLNSDKKEVEKILRFISKNSSNSFRDSITNLEKVLHTYHEKISKKDLYEQDLRYMFGDNRTELYVELFRILSEKNIEKLFSYIKDKYPAISYDNLLDYIRAGMFIRNGVAVDSEYEEKEFLEFVQSNQAFFTSANLLYFLEKCDLYRNIQDKENVLVAIFGNFIEKNSSN